MLNYETYLARHGEYGVQAIIEKLERYEGITSAAPLSLEQRWNAVMHTVTSEQTYTRAA